MKNVLLLLVILIPLTAAAQSQPKPVIFDTDMAIDDWFALLYLAKSPNAELLAVTISNSGETDCKPGLVNATNLLKLARHADLPVSCGDDYPLDGYFIFPEPWRDDSNTLSGIDLGKWLEQPVTAVERAQHAVETLHAAVQNSKQPVTIIAVGPMTNIAQWLQRYPEDRKNVEELVVMGGSYQAPGNILVPKFTPGHPNRVSEWNFFIDPLATQQVLTSGLPIVMVGLDVTNTVRVTHAFADKFKSQVSGPTSQFADAILDNNRWFIDTDEYYFWDVMAAIIAMQPSLCEGPIKAVTALVESAGDTPHLQTSDLNMPTTNALGAPRRHLLAANAGAVVDNPGAEPATKVCMKTNASEVYRQFVNVLIQ